MNRKRIMRILLLDISAFGSFVAYSFFIAFFFAMDFLQASTLLLVSGALGMTLALGIRRYFPRMRPDKQQGESFLEQLDAASFPSMHALRIGILCTVVMVYFQDLVSALFLFAGISVLYSRVYLERHDVRDIFAGVVLGIVLTLLLWYVFF